MTTLAERAEALARSAHAGQKDKVGAAYIGHPGRVAARTALIAPEGIREEAVAAAWLHDTVEDTGVSLSALREQGFPESVVDAVDRLSRRPGVSPEEYFARLRQSAVARIVKVADLIDNTTPERAAELDAYTRARLQEKYTRLWQLILGEV
jgi:(p)ppGpp synthase/HD superfamily hydrolase